MKNDVLFTIFKDIANKKPIARFIDVSIQLDEEKVGLKLNLN